MPKAAVTVAAGGARNWAVVERIKKELAKRAEKRKPAKKEKPGRR